MCVIYLYLYLYVCIIYIYNDYATFFVHHTCLSCILIAVFLYTFNLVFLLKLFIPWITLQGCLQIVFKVCYSLVSHVSVTSFFSSIQTAKNS